MIFVNEFHPKTKKCKNFSINNKFSYDIFVVSIILELGIENNLMFII